MGPTGIVDVFALWRAGFHPLRWRQQHRALPDVRAGLDLRRSHAKSDILPAFAKSHEKGHAEGGDVEAGGVVSCSVPATRRILAAQPWSPIVGFLAISFGWRSKSSCRRVAVRARVRCAAWLYLACPYPCQITLVREHAPHLPPHCRVIPPVAEAAAHSWPTPDGFQGAQVFPTDQLAAREQGQQDEQVRGEMGQFPIPPLILFPALFDPCVILFDMLLPSWKMGRRWGLLLLGYLDCLGDELLIPLLTCFEAIDLPAQTRLAAIDASRIQKQWAAHLSVWFLAIVRLF